MDQDLIGKVALVTGASRGIGAAIARRLAGAGAFVAVNYNTDETGAAETVAAIRADGGSAEPFQADVASVSGITTLIDRVVAQFGHLDVLVNNAWLGTLRRMMDTDEATYDALFALTKAAFFSMKRAGQVLADNGRIVNISSMSTRTPGGGPAYSASKAALETFTRAFAHEVGARGITVNAVLPGLIDTALLATLTEAQRQGAIATTALRRLGQPEELAELVGFLVSPKGRWITGELLAANGGRL
jgi:3-oxoacyl-[acyl-carrier protein] reductase